MTISLIAAIDSNRALGLNNQMLWHLPADFAWFRQHTLTKPVIMGRKTYESIGKALPNRLNIVLSRKPLELTDAVVVHSLDEAQAVAQRASEISEIMVIGGADIYAQFLPLADRLYLTHVEAVLCADAFFPEYLNSPMSSYHWVVSEESHFHKDEKNAYNMTFKIYERQSK